MRDLVVDASLALSWLLPDESTPLSLSAREELVSAETVWAAAHWRLEVCNALWMAERRKRLDASGIAQAVALFTQWPVSVDPETNDHAGTETLALARKHGSSVYDAAYLELALRRGAGLASLDRPLRAIARKLGILLIPKRLPSES